MSQLVPYRYAQPATTTISAFAGTSYPVVPFLSSSSASVTSVYSTSSSSIPSTQQVKSSDSSDEPYFSKYPDTDNDVKKKKRGKKRGDSDQDDEEDDDAPPVKKTRAKKKKNDEKKMTRAEVDKELIKTSERLNAAEEKNAREKEKFRDLTAIVQMNAQEKERYAQEKEKQYQLTIAAKDAHIGTLMKQIDQLNAMLNETRKDTRKMASNASELAHNVVMGSQNQVSQAIGLASTSASTLHNHQFNMLEFKMMREKMRPLLPPPAKESVSLQSHVQNPQFEHQMWKLLHDTIKSQDQVDVHQKQVNAALSEIEERMARAINIISSSASTNGTSYTSPNGGVTIEEVDILRRELPDYQAVHHGLKVRKHCLDIGSIGPAKPLPTRTSNHSSISVAAASAVAK
jgi:hypothetical protein